MRAPKTLLKLLGLCLMAGVLVAGMVFPTAGAIGMVSNQASDTVDSISSDLVSTDPPLVTTILDKNGGPIAYLYDQYRVPASFDQIANTMKAAIIAVEDKRFYDHQGVDWQGTFRAAITNQLQGQVSQGGSTLTQQYVKNYLINVVDRNNKAEQDKAQAPTAARKLREARVAIQLEREMSKNEILARYLNVVSFGNQTYGVGAAAHTYFNTTPDKLTIAQAALLAGIANNPSALNPYIRPVPALERRNWVIDKMVENDAFGPDHAKAVEIAEAAKKEPLGLADPIQRLPNRCYNAKPENGFFCAYVLEYLQQAGFTKEMLETGGLTIKTTMDPLQAIAAKKAAEAQVPKLAPGIANAVAFVQPGKTKHEVTALAANRDYGIDPAQGQTTQELPSEVTRYGAGSIYKIFTSAAALERGMGIFDNIETPSTYTSGVFHNNGGVYTVKNVGTSYPPNMTLQQALATSPNTGFIKIEEKIGVPAAVDMATRLGLRNGMNAVNGAGLPLKSDGTNGPSYGNLTKRQNNGSFTLGPGPTSVLELANVDATLFSGGTYCPPSPIQQVLDRNGKIVPVSEAPCEQVVDERLANTMLVGMSKDDTGGGTSAGAAKNADWTRPVAGKTGTTEDYFSVGFVGGVPQLAGAVMTFNDGVRQQVICRGSPPHLCGVNGGPGVYGGDVAAPTFYRALKEILGNAPVLPLPPADPRYADGGAAGILIPEVMGHLAADASAAISRTGFQPSVQEIPSNLPKGTVIGETPHGPAAPGTTVTLYTSNGYLPPPRTSVSPAAPPPGG